ncbi:MAG: hypothetical protein AB7R89_26160 [Dehalococcoidia bacterium]
MNAERLLEESEKMRRVPGITFVDGPCGRSARILGTGLDVFEIIQAYRAVGEDLRLLIESFHWLTGDQILAALRYDEEFPEEIDAILDEAAKFVPEELRNQYVFQRVRHD